jgi:hypothetical protein
MHTEAKQEIPDPTSGIAANLDQNSGSGSCVKHAIAACLYEQVFALGQKYLLKKINLS